MLKKTLIRLTKLILFVLVYSFSYSQNIGIFFTHKDNVLEKIISQINDSKKTIHICVFEINHEKIIESLIKAKKRGIDVKMVIDDREKNSKEVNLLRTNKIPIVFDNKRSYMHNKIYIFDQETVITGSLNLTYNDINNNRNNIVVIKDNKLADRYEEEFREMFDNKIFGKGEKSKNYYFKVDETDINVFFSPEDNVDRIIIDTIGKAKKSLKIAAFALTHKKIIEKIREISKKASVEIILDKSQSRNKDSIYQENDLKKLIKIYNGKGKMHNKFIIIDDKKVITGSFNFSKNATEKNDENILIITDNNIAKLYEEEFKRIERDSE